MKLGKMITAATVAAIAAAMVAAVPANAGHDKNHSHGETPPEQTETLRTETSRTKDRAEHAGEIIQVRVNGLVCDFCAQSIRKVFLRTGAVNETEVDLKDRRVTVYLKEGGNLTDETVKKLLEDSGYSTVSISRSGGEEER